MEGIGRGESGTETENDSEDKVEEQLPRRHKISYRLSDAE